MSESGTPGEDSLVNEKQEEEQKIKIIENEKPVMGDRGSLVIHKITSSQTSDWMLLASRCVVSAAYDSCGKYLALGLFDGQVNILVVSDIVLRVRTIPRPEQRRVENDETFHYHPGSANSLSWSLDSRYVVVSHLPQKQQQSVGNSNCSTIVVWKVGGMKKVSQPLATLRCTSVVTNVAVAGSNPLSFIVCGKGGTAWLYVEAKRKTCTPRDGTRDRNENELLFEHRIIFSEKPADESNCQFFTMAAVWLSDNRMAIVANSSGVIVKVDTSTSEVKARCELPWAASPLTMQILHSEIKLVISGRGVILLPLDTLSFSDAIIMGENTGRGQGISKYKGYWAAVAVGNITGQKHDDLAIIASSASPLTQSSLYTWFIHSGDDSRREMGSAGGREKWEGYQIRQVEVHETPNREAIVAMRIHPKRPMVLAITADGDALARIPNMCSDFAGPMYPSGYRITNDNVEYHEPEDELDYTIVKAGKQWTKVPVHEVVVRGPNEIVLDEESGPQSFCDPNEFVDLCTESEPESYCIIPDLSSLHFCDRLNDLQCTEMFKRRKIGKSTTKGDSTKLDNMIDMTCIPAEPDGDPTMPQHDESRESCQFPPLHLPVPLEVRNGSLRQKFGEKWAANNELRVAGIPQYMEKQAVLEKKKKADIERRQAKVAARREAKEAEKKAANEEMRRRAEGHAKALKLFKLAKDKSSLAACSSMKNYQTVMNNDELLNSVSECLSGLSPNAQEIPLQHLDVLAQWPAERHTSASASQSANNCSSQIPQMSTEPQISLISSVVADETARTVESLSQDLKVVPPYQGRPKSLTEILSVQEQHTKTEVPQLPQQPVLKSQQDSQSKQGLSHLPIWTSQQGLPQQLVLKSQQDSQSKQGLSHLPIWTSQQGLPQQPVLMPQHGLPHQLSVNPQRDLPQQGLPQHLHMKIHQKVLAQAHHGLYIHQPNHQQQQEQTSDQ